jgi:hypothetical protein
VALAGDLADKNLRNLPAVLGTTIVPVLIAVAGSH